jgi:hypothetical protein
MKKDIAKAWVTALRDPNAKQATRALGTPLGARCCLGVLCDLAVQAAIIAPPERRPFSQMEYAGETLTLPARVMAWAGVQSKNGKRKRALVTLSVLTDHGAPFTEIADIIENEWEEL